MATHQRAIREADKLERRQSILDAAGRLFRAMPYEDIAVAQIAEDAGLAKGTVYLYFKTKEEVFLGVTESLLAGWFDELGVKLRRLGESDATHVARTITATLNKRPDLLRLLAMLHTVLEQNAGVDAVRSFKRFLQERLAVAGAAIEGCLPFMKRGQGAHALLQLYALVIGMQHLANPAPAAQRVIQEEGLNAFDLRFDTEFSAAAAALLNGLSAMSAMSA